MSAVSQFRRSYPFAARARTAWEPRTLAALTSRLRLRAGAVVRRNTLNAAASYSRAERRDGAFASPAVSAAASPFPAPCGTSIEQAFPLPAGGSTGPLSPVPASSAQPSAMAAAVLQPQKRHVSHDGPGRGLYAATPGIGKASRLKQRVKTKAEASSHRAIQTKMDHERRRHAIRRCSRGPAVELERAGGIFVPLSDTYSSSCYAPDDDCAGAH
jgi:hypothetical protein